MGKGKNGSRRGLCVFSGPRVIRDPELSHGPEGDSPLTVNIKGRNYKTATGVLHLHNRRCFGQGSRFSGLSSRSMIGPSSSSRAASNSSRLPASLAIEASRAVRPLPLEDPGLAARSLHPRRR